MAKKAARKSAKTAAPRAARKAPKKAAETRTARQAPEVLALVTGVMAAQAPAGSKTAKFSRIQVTVTLSGSGRTPQGDVLVWTPDDVPIESSGFGNQIKPLLMEVLKKLTAAYPSEPSITLGLDDKGELVPTGQA